MFWRFGEQVLCGLEWSLFVRIGKLTVSLFTADTKSQKCLINLPIRIDLGHSIPIITFSFFLDCLRSLCSYHTHSSACSSIFEHSPF